MIEQFAGDQVQIPREEVLRYLGCGKGVADESICALVDDCTTLFCGAAAYRACRLRTGVRISGSTVIFDAFETESEQLSRNLNGCSEVILFAATVGIGADRLITRFQQTSPAKALALDAIGSAAVEAWCDKLCAQWAEELSAEGLKLRPRFSPGYGDLSLSVQQPLLQWLNTPRTVGINLTDTLLMLPRKSVSAIIGLSKDGCGSIGHDCSRCSAADCAFRR